MQVSLGFWLFGREDLTGVLKYHQRFMERGSFFIENAVLDGKDYIFGQQRRRLRVVSFVRINSSSEVCFIRSPDSTHFLLVCWNLSHLTLWFS